MERELRNAQKCGAAGAAGEGNGGNEGIQRRRRCRDVLCTLDPLHKQATQRGTGRMSGLLASGVACSLPPRSVPRRRQSPSDQNPRSRGGRRRQQPLYPCQLGHGTLAGAAAVAWRRRR
eukprot:gene8559-biopygen18137